MSKFLLNSFPAILLALIASFPVKSQEATDDMLKITVTGTKSESTVKDYAGSVDVIDKDDFDKSPSVDIRNLLKNVPGVTTRKTTRSGVRGTPGISDVNIRGLDGDRILFLIDGIRLPDRYEYGGYYNLGQADYVDFSFLKSIEIIKGSISSLYGSDALGGLISYRTLEPYDILKKDSNFNVEIPFNYFTEDNGRAFSNKIAVKLSENLSALFIYSNEVSGATKTAAPSKYIDDVENYGDNALLNLQYDVNDESSLNIILEDINRSSRIDSSSANLQGMSSTFSNYQKLISNTLTDRTRISAKYSYDSNDEFSFIQSAASTFYWQDAQVNDNFRRVVGSFDQMREEDKIYSLTNTLIGLNSDFSSDIILFDTVHTLGYGFDVSENDGSRTRQTKNLSTGVTEIVKDTPDTKTLRARLYLQDQFSLGDFDFTAGVGYDYYALNADNGLIYNPNQEDYILASDQSYQVVSPKFTVSYQPSDESSIYARYSQGFRPPVWYELSSSFANPSFGYITLSNPDLKPETSHDFEIGYKLNGDNYATTFATFYNRYSDFMAAFAQSGLYTIPGDTRELNAYQTQNVSDVEIYGVEFAGIYYFSSQQDGFYVGNVFAWSEGNNLTDAIPLETIVPVTNRLSLGYQGLEDRWLVSIGMVYTGRPRLSNDYQEARPYYIPSTSLIFDLEAYWNISDSVSLNASINNLTNETYFNFQDVRGRDNANGDILRFSQPERNFQIGAKFTF
tara:strand:+ start:521 stop:2725 length:2205 start_codon:yes stop_codon:yes gene_type:complete